MGGVEIHLPHGETARFLTKAGKIRDTIVGAGKIPPDHVLVHEGSAPAIAAVELAAQAATVGIDVESRGYGFIARLRSLEFHTERFPADMQLRAILEPDGQVGPLHRYRFTVTGKEGAIVEGMLSLYV